MLLANNARIVPAKAVIERDAGSEAVVILKVEAEIVLECVPVGVAAVLEAATNISREKIR